LKIDDWPFWILDFGSAIFVFPFSNFEFRFSSFHFRFSLFAFRISNSASGFANLHFEVSVAPPYERRSPTSRGRRRPALQAISPVIDRRYRSAQRTPSWVCVRSPPATYRLSHSSFRIQHSPIFNRQSRSPFAARPFCPLRGTFPGHVNFTRWGFLPHF
jgi:hypothetical protein